MGQLLGSRFTKANLSGADLSDTLFGESDFLETNLSGAKLCSADLEWAFLAGANLTDADLTGTNLKRADLTDVVGLTKEQVDSAVTDEWTTLPDYLEAFDSTAQSD